MKINTLLFLQLVALNLWAQTYTGKVVDEQGDPLPGVLLYIQSTNINTLSDVDGTFYITSDKVPFVLVATISTLRFGGENNLL